MFDVRKNQNYLRNTNKSTIFARTIKKIPDYDKL